MSVSATQSSVALATTKIKLFVKGDDRTPFTADTMNEIVIPLNALKNLEIRRGPTDGVFVADGNYVIQIKNGGSAVGVATALPFQVKQEFSDYLQCVSLTDPGYVYVAKPILLRRSLAARTEDGIAMTFTYAYVTATFPYSYTNWQRTQHVVTPAGLFDDEIHLLKPAYLASGINGDFTPKPGGDVIWCVSVAAAALGMNTNPSDTGTPGVATAITWIDMNPDGRVWKQVGVLPSP